MWNDNLYRKYMSERMQPSIDLANRLELEDSSSILDIGCGSGMSTQAAMSAMPRADRVVGVDYSSEMLAVAREKFPRVEWIQRDCSKSLEDLGQFDLVFSNAFLQWLSAEDQKTFVKNSVKNVAPGGTFAIQIPNFDALPVAKCCKLVNERWQKKGKLNLHTGCKNFTALEYYDMFSEVYSDVTIWTTTYYHKMNEVSDIVEFVKATAIHEAFQQLDSIDRLAFSKELEEELSKYYHKAQDGTLLYPFERIFLIAK